MTYWSSTWGSKSVDREFESQNFPLEVFHPRRCMFLDSLWAGDSLRSVELGLFVGPPGETAWYEEACSVPVACLLAGKGGKPCTMELGNHVARPHRVTGACPSQSTQMCRLASL